MPNLEPTFWLLVAFIIFFALIFKVITSFTSSAILRYKKNVTESIESIERQRIQTNKDIHTLQLKTQEVKQTCDKILNAAILEIKKIEDKAQREITDYSNFKIKHTEERIKIFTNTQVTKMKQQVLNHTMKIVNNYFSSKKQGKINFEQLKDSLK